VSVAWIPLIGVLLLGATALALLRRRAEAPWAREVWALRAGIIITCALAAGAPEAPLGSAHRRRAIVLDRSRSLARSGDVVEHAAWDALADLLGGDQVGLVVAGADPVIALDLSPLDVARGALGPALRAGVDPWGTDLGAALRAAGHLVGDGGEVVLITDGRDTAGQALQAAGELAARRIRVYPLAPDAPTPFGARLVLIDAPERVAAGARASVRVQAQTLNPADLSVQLELVPPAGEGGAHPHPSTVGRVERRAVPGAPLEVSFSLPPLERGVVTLRARVSTSGRDDAPEDDVLACRIVVGDAAHVLRVGAPLAGIAGEGVPPEGLREALARSGVPPDLVILHNVPASRLPAEATAALRRATEAGTGLAVVGAGSAFGPGGYAGSPLEALLPVTSGPGQERRRPLLLVVALDASGSMAGATGRQSRYQQALAAALPLARLEEGDLLGVTLFADAPRRLHPLGPPPPDLVERLSEVDPEGGTDIGAALVSCLEELAAAPSQEADRLVILATDSEDAAPRRHAEALRALAARVEALRVKVLLVRIGATDAPALEALRGFLTPRVEVEVQRAADAGEALRALVEGELLTRKASVRRASEGFAVKPTSADLGAALPPRVTAFAPVRARTEPEYAAQPLAAVVDPETADPPLVVLGRLGLGRTLALATEGAPAAQLLAAVWPRLLPPRQRGVQWSVRRSRDELSVEARGDGLPEALRVRALGEDGGEAEAALAPYTDTSSRARLASPTSGPLHAVLLSARGERLAVRTLPGAAHEELAWVGPDHASLTAIAQATGGRHLVALPAQLPPGKARRSEPLGPWLALIALSLLLLEAGAATLRTRLTARRLELSTT